MKIILSLFIGFVLFTFAGSSVFAQHRNLTIVLLRHAEKDASPTADKTNPELSSDGKLRAQRLVKIINKYKPDAIYSSDFIRTRTTAEPLAEKRKLTVQIYNHRNLKELADLILSGKIKRLVVVGHNTTTPALVNLLIGQEKYKALAESEYDKIFVVKIKKKKNKPNKIKEKVITY
ncbi:MAG TPA: phosphoglycerate mutase family protein [Pyrinomonadaceae bacterium]|jgi:phosphohistidine phosphatase SixA|nr:phosphoglycerate mutase family protein [Pyrinomonadaceae bacterium]